MIPLKTASAEFLEELYLTIPKSLAKDEVVEALVLDQKEAAAQYDFSKEDMKEHLDNYRSLLKNLGLLILYDMAYETCVSTNRLDPNSNSVWVDRKGKYQVNPDELYKQSFIESVFSVKSMHSKLNRNEREKVAEDIKSLLKKGSGEINLPGNFALSIFNKNANITGIDLNGSEPSVKRVAAAYKQYIGRPSVRSNNSLILEEITIL